MLDSIYHIPSKLCCYHFFGVKMSRFGHLLLKVVMDVMTLLICKPLVVYRFYFMMLYHSHTRRHMINRGSYMSDHEPLPSLINLISIDHDCKILFII